MKLDDTALDKINNRTGSIYCLVDPRVLNEVRYIGQTVQPLSSRVKRHIAVALREGTTSVQKWIAGLVSDGVFPEAIALESNVPAIDLNEDEIEWIARAKREGYNLTNGTIGGSGFGYATRVISDDTRKRMSLAQLGKKVSEATRKKQSESGKGKKHNRTFTQKEKDEFVARIKGTGQTPEAIAKRSASSRGRVVSEETKRKIADAQTGEKNHRYGKHWTDTQRRASEERVITDEFREKMRIVNAKNLVKKRENGTDRGWKLSEDAKRKISQSSKGKTRTEEERKETRIKQRRFSTNKSGYSNVSWNSQFGKWDVNFISNGIKHHVGAYHILQEAVLARNIAMLDYYQDYSIVV